jgi:hypothetical protein
MLDVTSPEVQAKLDELKRLKQVYAVKESYKLSKARKYYPYFAEYILKDESTGDGIQMAPIHLKWIEHINMAWSNGLHAFILAPYGSGKTAHIAVGIPLYLFGIDTSLRMMLVSANDSIAKDRLMLVRQYIDYSPEYHKLFPHVKADEDMGWTKTAIYLKRQTYSKDPSLCVSGATGSKIGKRLDVLILDDVNDAKNTIHQPRTRDVIWTNFTGVWTSRLEPGGKILAIQTRWHEEDLVGKILNDVEMRSKYAFLIQRVSEDFESIECETIIPANARPSKVQHRAQLESLFKMYQEGVI